MVTFELCAGARGGQLGDCQHFLREGRHQERGAVHGDPGGEGGVAGVPLPRHQEPLHPQVLAPGGARHPPASGLGDREAAASHAEAGELSEVHGVLRPVLHPQTQTQLQILWRGELNIYNLDTC